MVSKMVMAVLASSYAAVLPPAYPTAYSPYHHAPAPVPVPVHHVPPPSVYHAAPPHVGQVIPIVSQSYDANPDGSYVFQYESGDGSSRQEQGTPNYGKGAPGVEGTGGVAVQGRFAYASPEGPVEVQYIADENGYQPQGSHIHPEIIKAVAAQVAYARAEGPTAYAASPAIYKPVPVYAQGPPPPPPGYSAYPYKA